MNLDEDQVLHTKIGKYFLLITAILLILPFSSNDIAKPLNNPNTSFENYPLELQKAYGESQVGTITRGEDYTSEIIAVVNATHVIKKQMLGLPKFVQDSNGDWVHAIISSNATHIISKNAQNPLVFKKADCTFTKYTDSMFTTKSADYYTTMATKPSGQQWSVFDALSLSCTYNTFTNSTGKYLTVQRVHSKGTFDVTYANLANGTFKTFSQFTNNQSPNGLQNTKVSFVEILGNITASNFIIENQDKFNSIAVGTQKIWTQQNMTKKLFSVYDNTKVFDVDLGNDFSDLLALRVTKQTATTLKIEIAFGATATNLQYGQIVRNDPTFGYTAGTEKRASDTTACNGTTGSWPYGGSAIVGGDGDFCYSDTFEWDISSISDLATITDVDTRHDLSTLTGDPACQASSMANVRPSTASLTDALTQIRTGTSYTAITCNLGDTNDILTDLGTTADTDVQNKLTLDWFAIAVRKNPYDTTNNNVIWGTTELQVTYTEPVKQQVKFRLFESDGTTAVASTSIIIKNSTATTTLTANSTGVTPAIGLNTSTNQNITAKTSTNYVFYKQFNWQPTANQTETRTGNIYDVTGCDTSISNLMMNDTDRHYVASVPLTPSCSNDVLTFNYFYKRIGIGSAGTNQTTTIRFEVPHNSIYATVPQILVNGSSISSTYSSGVVTSSAIQVDNGANNVILKVTVNLRGIHRVISYENDKATALTSGSVIWKNGTTTETSSINATGFVQLSGITGSGNITQKEGVDNFVTNKTYGIQLAGNIGLIGLIFDGSCPQNGAGNDFQFKINATNYHRISSHTTPTCATTGNNLNVTAIITFTADGNPSSLANETSTIDIDISNTTAFGKNLIRLRENGTAIGTTYSSGEITSSAIQIAHGLKTVVLNINFALDPKPSIPSNPTGTCDTDSCTPTWPAPASGVSAITSYTLQYKTDSTDWANLVTQSGTSYEHTGLTTSTNYYYRVLATNSYGSSAYSEQGSGTTTSGSSITGGSSGGSSPSQNNIFGQALDTIFNLSLFGKEKLLSFGEIDKTGQIVVKWTVKDEIQVNQILYDVPEGFTFTPATPPFVLEKQPDGTRENYIPYTIIAPRKCDPENPKLELRVTENCQKAGLYKISVSVGVSESGVFTTQATEIPIRLGEAIFDPAMLARYSIFLVPSVIIVGFVAQHYIRKTKRTTAKKTIAKHYKNHTRKK